MKTRILILSILVALTTNLFSQDIILMRDGSQIKGKVTEFQDNLVKYKSSDFLEGPTRSVSLPNVAKIEYESGRVEYFTQVEVSTKAPVQPENVTKEESGEIANVSYKPLRIFGRISGQRWHNKGLSEFFGINVLCGAGIEKQASDHFKFGANVDFTSKTQDGVTFNYTQLGAFVKFSWGFFGSKSPVIYNQLGVKGTFLKGIEDSYSASGNGIGFSAILGLEIPIGNNVALDLGWDSVFSNITFEEERVNLRHEAFFGGLLFSF